MKFLTFGTSLHKLAHPRPLIHVFSFQPRGHIGKGHYRVSQGAKSMKNYTSSPDSRSLCQVHHKNAKNPNFEADLGVPHPLPNFA